MCSILSQLVLDLHSHCLIGSTYISFRSLTHDIMILCANSQVEVLWNCFFIRVVLKTSTEDIQKVKWEYWSLHWYRRCGVCALVKWLAMTDSVAMWAYTSSSCPPTMARGLGFLPCLSEKGVPLPDYLFLKKHLKFCLCDARDCQECTASHTNVSNVYFKKLLIKHFPSALFLFCTFSLDQFDMNQGLEVCILVVIIHNFQ